MSQSIVQHAPWQGDGFKNDRALMLWGFSHHRRRDEDDEADFTVRTIRSEAIDGNHWFFNRLREVTGGTDRSAFWHSVAFANTLPDAVVDDDIYSAGTDDARRLVKARVSRILKNLQPRRVILFSRKGWRLWPEFDGAFGEPERTIDGAPLVKWGSYNVGAEWETLAYNLPHPQFQRTEDLRLSVEAIRRHSPSD